MLLCILHNTNITIFVVAVPVSPVSVPCWLCQAWWVQSIWKSSSKIGGSNFWVVHHPFKLSIAWRNFCSNPAFSELFNQHCLIYCYNSVSWAYFRKLSTSSLSFSKGFQIFKSSETSAIFRRNTAKRALVNHPQLCCAGIFAAELTKRPMRPKETNERTETFKTVRSCCQNSFSAGDYPCWTYWLLRAFVNGIPDILCALETR